MARIYPLFSSSSGNCTYIGDENGGVLIDAGVSCRRICAALGENGIPLGAVRGIFITHTHSDHIAGLRVLSKKLDADVWALEENLRLLIDSGKVFEGARLRKIQGPAQVGGFTVEQFETYHDTPANCGYRITCPDGKRCAVCTDTGRISPEIHSILSECSLVLLESNYDPDMLMRGDYPPEIKSRIASDRGHLSNEDCGRELRELASCGVNTFILGHISPRNNTPEAAELSAVRALEGYVRGEDYLLHIARPEGGGPIAF